MVTINANILRNINSETNVPRFANTRVQQGVKGVLIASVGTEDTTGLGALDTSGTDRAIICAVGGANAISSVESAGGTVVLEDIKIIPSADISGLLADFTLKVIRQGTDILDLTLGTLDVSTATSAGVSATITGQLNNVLLEQGDQIVLESTGATTGVAGESIEIHVKYEKLSKKSSLKEVN